MKTLQVFWIGFIVAISLLLGGHVVYAQKLSEKDKKPSKKARSQYVPFKGSRWRGDRRPHRQMPPEVVSQYRGPYGGLRKEGDSQDLVRNYPQAIPYRVLKRMQQRAKSIEKHQARYKGTVALSRSFERRKRNIARQMQAYRGDIRVKKNRQKSYADRYTGKPHRVGLSPYRDPRYAKKGKRILFGKKDMPRWQREKAPKLRYDRQENKIWAKPRPVPPPKERRTTHGGE